MGKFFASFTRTEKQTISFILALVIGGFGVKSWVYGHREPIVVSSLDTGRNLLPAEKSLTPGGKVLINEADAPALETLPGIGPQFARIIIAHREAHGPFRTADDLDAVQGVGPSLLTKILPQVDFTTTIPATANPINSPNPASQPNLASPSSPGISLAPSTISSLTPQSIPTNPAPPLPPTSSPAPAKPIVNINTAGRTELDTLDGIGPALANRILADRQAHGPYRTIQELTRVKGIGPKVIQQNWNRLRIQ